MHQLFNLSYFTNTHFLRIPAIPISLKKSLQTLESFISLFKTLQCDMKKYSTQLFLKQNLMYVSEFTEDLRTAFFMANKTQLKIPQFYLISWCEILWKDIVSAQFRANCPKLCGNCAFSQSYHTKRLGEITVLFAIKRSLKI